MHAVFNTSTHTSVIPLIIAVDSLAYSLHKQGADLPCAKYNSTQQVYNNSPCSAMTKLPYTVFIYSMIVHLHYASTCYDKLIICYTQ